MWECEEPLEILGFSRVSLIYEIMEKYRNVVQIGVVFG